MHTNSSTPGGSPVRTNENEVTENDELIRQDLNLIFELVKNKLVVFFVKEKAKGRLSKSVREDEMADYCLAVVQGAMLMGKIRRDSAVVEKTLRTALSSIRANMLPARDA